MVHFFFLPWLQFSFCNYSKYAHCHIFILILDNNNLQRKICFQVKLLAFFWMAFDGARHSDIVFWQFFSIRQSSSLQSNNNLSFLCCEMTFASCDDCWVSAATFTQKPSVPSCLVQHNKDITSAVMVTPWSLPFSRILKTKLLCIATMQRLFFFVLLLIA